MKPRVFNPAVVGLLSVFFPLSVLLLFPKGGFDKDWYNFLYMAGYTGEYFSAHGEFPTHFNAIEFMGNPFPVFYGYLLFPVWGVLSSFLGVHLSLRVLTLILFSLQYVLVFRLGNKLSQSKTVGLLLAILVTWAIYPLTNLYNRSALPECFATVLLVISVCAWYEVILSSSELRRWRYALLFASCTILMAGFHAITGLYGTLWLCIFVTVTLVKYWRTHVKFAIVAGLLFAVVLSPWVYLVAKYSAQTEIGSSLERIFYYDGIDDWWVRLFPLPLDWRSILEGTKAETPFLDAQLNLPLFVLFIFLLFKGVRKKISPKWKGLAGACCFLSVLHFFISFHEGVGETLGFYSTYLQIGYRAVTYFNLFALWGIFLLLKEMKDEKIETLFLVFLITWAGAGIVVKLVHAGAALPLFQVEGYDPYTKLKPESFLTLPKSFYSLHNYTVPKKVVNVENFKDDIVRAQFIPGRKKEFGKLNSVTVELKKPGWVFTNIASFPWNRISVDGVLLNNNDSYQLSHPIGGARGKILLREGSLAFSLETAGTHQVSLVQEIDLVYLKLRQLAFVSFVLLFTVLIIVSLLPSLFSFRFSNPRITADMH